MKILYCKIFMFKQSKDYLRQLKNNQEQTFLDQSFLIFFIFIEIGTREIQEDIYSHKKLRDVV